jgi:zinc protease
MNHTTRSILNGPGMLWGILATLLAVAETDSPAGSTLLTLDPQIRTGQLDNGLTYFIRPNQKPENRAALRLAVNAGSVLEDDDQQGLAHFLEHMAFNGSRHFPKQELVDFLEGIGMRFGPDLNAYTGFDETVYLLEIPLDDPAILEQAFLVLEDWAAGLDLDPAEIEKERGVIKEEWRLGRGAQQRVLDRQIPVLLRDSLYADRLPIGQPEIIDTAEREALARFYQDWYRPDLMAVVAVGDFEPDRIEALIRQHFQPLHNPVPSRPRPIVPVPDHTETLFSIVTDPELPYTAVQIATKRDTIDDRTEADYRRGLIETLAIGMLNDRLNEKVHEADPPYLFAGVGEVGLARTKDLLLQTAVIREDALDRGLNALLLETRRVNRDGFTSSEFDRIRAATLRQYEQAYQERDKTSSAVLANELVRHFLSGEPAPGIAKELELAQRFLPEITLTQVNQAAREWLTPTNRVVLYSAPSKSQVAVPTEAQILAWVQAAEAAPVEAYDDALLDSPLMPRLPEPGRVIAEDRHDRIELVEWRLSNGVIVLLRPTDFKNDQVLLRGFSPGGHSLVPDELYVAASTATDVVGQSGLGAFNLVQLQKNLADKIARASVGISSQFQTVSGFASPQDLETLFQLVHLRFTAPRAEPDTFQSLQTRLRDVIENRRNDPEAVFGDALTKALYQDHPRHQPLSLATLEQMDREASLRIYRDRFGDAGDFTFVLLGNFTLEEIRPLVEQYLASLPAAGRQERGRSNDDDPVRGQVTLTVRKGIEPRAQVQIRFTGDTPWIDEARYPLRAAVDVLEMRLREILREDLGGTYGVSVYGDLQRWPKGTYACGIQFGCDPARVDDLIEVALAEVNRLQEEGPSADHLAKVTEQHLRQFEVGIRENPFWLNNLVFRAQHGLELEALLDLPERVRNLTAEPVAEAARKYFHPQNRFIARLLPEEVDQPELEIEIKTGPDPYSRAAGLSRPQQLAGQDPMR